MWCHSATLKSYCMSQTLSVDLIIKSALFINSPELIQTEMHHVRTLKILLYVYMYELRQSSLIEEAKLDRLFFGVEALLKLHQHFLNCLKARQKECQENGSPNNYQITQLGDILISQVGENNFRLVWSTTFLKPRSLL